MTTLSYDPRSGATLGELSDSTEDEVRAAVAAAHEASPNVADASPRARQVWLDAVAQTLLEHREELAELADRETALGMDRLRGEVERAASQLRFYAAVAVEGSYLGVTIDRPGAASPALVRVNVPLGPVAVFGASNFPFGFGVLGNDTASALAAGCPVVVKSHPAHPLLSRRLGELAASALAEAGAPEGTFGLVAGFEAGRLLVTHPDVRAVGFTGSQPGGLALWRLANEREVVIPVYAEMGTVNPAVMTPSAVDRLTEVAAGFVGSFTMGAGQFCTKPGLLLAPAGHGVARAVGEALVAAAPAPTMLTENIASALSSTVERLMAAGAEVVATAPGSGTGWSGDALVLQASADAMRSGGALTEECFGPVAVVVEYASVDEASEILAGLQGSLAATIVTADDADPDAAALLEVAARNVGRVTANDWPTGVAWTWAQQHGGPWPATSHPGSTSVGAAALDRFVRPIAYQSVPDAWLPEAAREANPWHLPRRVDGRLAR